MHLHEVKSGASIHRLIVLAFGLWLGGGGLLCGCAEKAERAFMLAAGPQAIVRVTEAHTHCPAHAAQTTSSLSPADGAVEFLTTAPANTERTGACCKQTRPVSDQARKPRVLIERAPGAIAAQAFRLLTVGVGARRAAALPVLADGRETHVRCRVFLI